MRRLLFILVLSLSASVGFAASGIPITGQNKSSYRTFDQKFVELMKQWNLVGATVAIVKQHKLAYLKAYGYSNLERKTPMQPGNLFRIASVSKTVTAIAVLKLIQEGKLSFDDHVFDILGLKPLPGQRLNSGVASMTIRQLLHMSAGWPKWFDPLFGPWPKSYLSRLGTQPPVTCERAARFMMSQPLQYKAGTKYQYSNMDYCLLGLVVSKLNSGGYTRQGYVDYVQKHLLSPIGIDDMYLANTQYGAQPASEVTYYPKTPPGLHKQGNPDVVYLHDLPYSTDQILYKNFANGGWVASAYDLVKLVNRLQMGQILSPRFIRQMSYMPDGYGYKPGKRFSFLPYPYGKGWFLIHDSFPGRVWYSHGSFTGTNAMVIRRPNGIIYVVLFNKKPTTYARVSALRHQVMRLLWQYG